MQRSVVANFVLTAKEVGALVLKMQGMEIIVDGTGVGEGSQSKARLQGQFPGPESQAQGQVGNFMGNLAVVKGMMWRAGSQGRLTFVPRFLAAKKPLTHRAGHIQHMPHEAALPAVALDSSLGSFQMNLWGQTWQIAQRVWPTKGSAACDLSIRTPAPQEDTQLNNQSHHGSEMLKYLFHSLSAICFCMISRAGGFPTPGNSLVRPLLTAKRFSALQKTQMKASLVPYPAVGIGSTEI